MYLSKIKLQKTLIKGIKRNQGRLKGKITVRHNGGGVKRAYRQINFKENFRKKGLIVAIEYDPYRNNFIAKVLLKKNNKYTYDYILCKQNTNVFQTILPTTENLIPNENYNLGKTFYLKNLGIGDTISNIEKYPGQGGIFARSAGCFGKIISLNEKRNLIRIQLPSGEQYYISKNCKANLGKMGNLFHQYLKKWKAGTSRRLSVRPKVRGVAKNPIDHPHGGGEGKSTSGRPPVSPTGKLTKGVPTRKKRKNSFFIALRKNKKN